MLTATNPTATTASALPDAPQPPRLLDRMRAAIRVKHYSYSTEKTYTHWVKRFIFFHGKRHPAEMGAAEVAKRMNRGKNGATVPETQD